MSDPIPPINSDNLDNAYCPYCSSICLQVSRIMRGFERHVHFYCACCRRVWMEREERAVERLAYQPPMAK